MFGCKMLHHVVHQIGNAEAMFGGDRIELVQAESVKLVEIFSRWRESSLLTAKKTGLLGFAQPVHRFAIQAD